ncbi:dienelactone hydrolase family protein [Aquincola sp. S2]|uniref:Dienelactone hydrolase family protein n=1 Tax=Pseudaquabacterium terrae TaxID=2732868 RepID=A0ABX2ETS7_9BURK|nr:dienelactone hydrolase family protein [Aquabacterium terrae]NRF72036.1 dienelactone hydrolase family protein [Aquabacterium terrae]
MKRLRLVLLAACAFITSAQAQVHAVRAESRIPTALAEQGQPVSLVLLTYRPPGPGPHPLVLFNHGSTGNGRDPERFRFVFDRPDVAQVFVDEGWMVAFLQRRGRGGSGGLYDEGFNAGRSGYSCAAALSLPGVDRALADIDIGLRHLRGLSEVDARRVVVAGQSRGGILAIAFAGQHADLLGAINFAGGWLGDNCADGQTVNITTFRRGTAFKQPTLWLYGRNDAFYAEPNIRRNLAAFVDGGGRAEFQLFDLGAGQNGHRLIDHPELWRAAVRAYLSTLR